MIDPVNIEMEGKWFRIVAWGQEKSPMLQLRTEEDGVIWLPDNPKKAAKLLRDAADMIEQKLCFEEKSAPPKSSFRSCNRHSDCQKAEDELLARNPGKTKVDININFHCHDEECEDCFGS
jgi:hypothetical protein